MAKKTKKSKIKDDALLNESENLKAVEASDQATNIESAMQDIAIDAEIFLQEEAASEGFLPEVSDETDEEELSTAADETDDETLQTADNLDLEDSELAGFETADIVELEFIEDEQIESIVESILFASDRPVSLASIREVFKGTNVKKDKLRAVLETLAVEYAGGRRGISLEEVTGGYQLRTKVDNMNFLKRTVKARPFKLSGPALETLAILAYKQPVVKSEIDQIRGVESGHLLRALMEKGLCNFEGKAENLPGKPMQYGTTRRFLEIFGLRNLKELPTLSQIDELLPEGIGDEEEAKPTLSMVTDSMSEEVKSVSYSEGEDELGKIENELSEITTSSDFFEQEKIRQKQKKEADKAQDIRDAMAVGETVSTRDKNWLVRYEESLNQPAVVAEATVETTVEASDKDISAEENSENEDNEMSLADKSFAEDADQDDDELFAQSDDEDAPHVEDELPFYEEADEEPSKKMMAVEELEDDESEPESHV